MSEKNHYSGLIQIEIRYFILFLLLSIVSPVLAFYTPWTPHGESLGVWMQRSGSVMVLFGLLAEARAINCFFILNPSGLVESNIDEAKIKYGSSPKLLNLIAFFIIALGTLIWGYGDIPFKI